MKQYRKKGRMVLPALFYFLLVLIHGASGEDLSLDFLYIVSSADEAAGGHAAVRFDQMVFHYQFYPEGYFLMVKEPWEEFRYQYNDLENRTIQIASLPLSTASYTDIFESFQKKYLLQEYRFQYLLDLEEERRFFQMIAGESLQTAIEGLGLFSRERGEDHFGSMLQEYIAEQLGQGYLAAAGFSGQSKLQTLRQTLSVVPLNLENNADGQIFFPPCRSREFVDLITLREAIAVLASSRSLAEDALLSPPGNGGSLSAAERLAFEQYAGELQDSIVGLLQSNRPDRGRILLLQAARFQAVHRSLEQNVLYTLDPFPSNAESWELPDQTLVQWDTLGTPGNLQESVGGPGVKSEKRFVQQLIRDGEWQTHAARASLLNSTASFEMAYNHLEIAQGKLAEYQHSAMMGTPVRIKDAALLPNRIRYLAEPSPADGVDWEEQVRRAEENLGKFRQYLHGVYNYNLFTRNCVTELSETAYTHFRNSEQIREALGGYFGPGDSLSFVPFLFFKKVRKEFSVNSIQTLPSFRLRELEKKYAENGLFTWFKESNTLTSNLYTPWDKDSTFLFFTDDLVLFRPILGTMNLLYATVSSLGGILSLPFDHGLLLKRGVRGMVFSLPEMAFFNIRKGTYPAVAQMAY